MKKKRRGFTLVELLTTIFLVSIAIGISGAFINNIISKSNAQKEEIALNNIKRTASTYVEEYPDDIIWNTENDISYSCIAVNLLAEKGYFNIKDFFILLKTRSPSCPDIDKTSVIITIINIFAPGSTI